MNTAQVKDREDAAAAVISASWKTYCYYKYQHLLYMIIKCLENFF